MAETQFSGIDDLERQMAWLHDCPFDLAQARFDRATREWQGQFLRPMWGSPKAKQRWRLLVVRESRLPVAEARLRLRRVTDVHVRNDQGIGTYGFNRVEPLPAGVRLLFNERMSVEVLCDGTVEGSYEETVVPDLRAVYRQFLILQTGPAIEATPGAPR
jgi:hypothetical protein